MLSDRACARVKIQSPEFVWPVPVAAAGVRPHAVLVVVRLVARTKIFSPGEPSRRHAEDKLSTMGRSSLSAAHVFRQAGRRGSTAEAARANRGRSPWSTRTIEDPPAVGTASQGLTPTASSRTSPCRPKRTRAKYAAFKGKRTEQGIAWEDGNARPQAATSTRTAEKAVINSHLYRRDRNRSFIGARRGSSTSQTSSSALSVSAVILERTTKHRCALISRSRCVPSGTNIQRVRPARLPLSKVPRATSLTRRHHAQSGTYWCTK